MNVDAIVEMFSRSEELYNVKYSTYIGDGDSKTFKGIIDSQPYKDFTIHKKSASIMCKNVWVSGSEI